MWWLYRVYKKGPLDAPHLTDIIAEVLDWTSRAQKEKRKKKLADHRSQLDTH
jgi:hypothetical protein